MKNLIIILTFFLFLTLTGFSQGENDNWYFSNRAAINFSLGYPVAIPSNKMTLSPSASISDAAGNLLFFTDGSKIWDRNQNVMPNSCCMSSSMYFGSQVVILPFPGHPNEYFVFTTQTGTGEIPAYSKVDMTANFGLGDVVLQNIPLEDPNGTTLWNSETYAITVLEDFNNYWVLIPYENKLLSYYVDQTGVNTTPTQSTINPLMGIGGFGGIKVSPNHNLLAITGNKYPFPAGQCDIYNFNPSTGQVQSATPLITFKIKGNNGIGDDLNGLEFSSNNNIVWMSSPNKIHGYNISNINNSPYPFIVFSTNTNTHYFGNLQLGPDNEIYVGIYDNNSEHTTNYYRYLGKINNSNNINTAALDKQYLDLTGTSNNEGYLPQLIPSSVCIPNQTLTGIDLRNFSKIYEVSNKITTLNYEALPILCQITMDAGNYIEMLPNTYLNSAEHGVILAKIGGCDDGSGQRPAPLISDNYQTKIINLSTDNSQLLDFEVFPNPIVDVLSIALPNGIKIQSANLYDILGKHMQITLEGNNMNMSGFLPGVYVLKIQTSQGILTTKVIKQ